MAEVLAPIPAVQLTDDFYVQFEAIDPATGAAVTGVTVANATLFVEDDGNSATVEPSGPFLFVPGPSNA